MTLKLCGEGPRLIQSHLERKAQKKMRRVENDLNRKIGILTEYTGYLLSNKKIVVRRFQQNRLKTNMFTIITLELWPASQKIQQNCSKSNFLPRAD